MDGQWSEVDVVGGGMNNHEDIVFRVAISSEPSTIGPNKPRGPKRYLTGIMLSILGHNIIFY